VNTTVGREVRWVRSHVAHLRILHKVCDHGLLGLRKCRRHLLRDVEAACILWLIFSRGVRRIKMIHVFVVFNCGGHLVVGVLVFVPVLPDRYLRFLKLDCGPLGVGRRSAATTTLRC